MEERECLECATYYVPVTDKEDELFEEMARDGQDVAGFSEPPFESRVSHVFEEARSVLLQKHHDYGPTNISRSPGGPLNGLRVRMWDKQGRINNLVDYGVDPENESLRDSFLDLANYSLIGVLVLDGKWPES